MVCSHYLLLVNVATAAASSQEAIRGAGGGGAAGRWTWGQSAAASSLCKDNPVPSPHIIDRPRCCGVGAGVGAHDQVMMKPKPGYGLGLGHGTLPAEEVSQSVCSRRGRSAAAALKGDQLRGGTRPGARPGEASTLPCSLCGHLLGLLTAQAGTSPLSIARAGSWSCGRCGRHAQIVVNFQLRNKKL